MIVVGANDVPHVLALLAFTRNLAILVEKPAWTQKTGHHFDFSSFDKNALAYSHVLDVLDVNALGLSWTNSLSPLWDIIMANFLCLVSAPKSF